MSDEAKVVAKVEELMRTLDEVKRYRALVRLLIDFLLIMLVSVVALLALELAVNTYRAQTGFPCYYPTLNAFLCTPVGGQANSPLLQVVATVGLFGIPIVSLLGGILWVDRKLKSVKGEEWKGILAEGFPGALKLLQQLNWDTVFEDIRLSRIGYASYFAVKVIGYWLLALFVIVLPLGFAVSAVHLELNLYIPAVVSFVLALVLSRGDLQRRYNQVVSLDTLMWELRWFSSGLGSAKFET